VRGVPAVIVDIEEWEGMMEPLTDEIPHWNLSIIAAGIPSLTILSQRMLS
jgi:hypothetical protein